VQSQVIETDSL